MSRARHKHRAAGGATKETVYAGAGSNVLKEAEGSDRKHGGRVHGEGEKAKERHDRKGRARGGSVPARKHGGRMKEGSKAEEARETKAEEASEHKRGGRTHGRARGGGIGANRTPLSTAATIKEVTKGEQAEDMGKQ